MAMLAAELKSRSAGRLERRDGAKSSLEVGDTISLTLGAETFSPVKYFTFVVGPISGTTAVREGESGDATFIRLSGSLSAMFECEFAMKCEQFLDRLEDVVKYAGGRKVSR